MLCDLWGSFRIAPVQCLSFPLDGGGGGGGGYLHILVPKILPHTLLLGNIVHCRGRQRVTLPRPGGGKELRMTIFFTRI